MQADTDPATGPAPVAGPTRDAGSPRSRDIDLVLNADCLSVRQALRIVLARLGHDISRSTASRLEIVLAEVLNNIVEHAYSEKGGSVGLTIARTAGELTITVIDDGCAMPEGPPPARAHGTGLMKTDDFPEGGFGWTLIHALAQELGYERQGSQNQLRIRLPLD